MGFSELTVEGDENPKSRLQKEGRIRNIQVAQEEDDLDNEVIHPGICLPQITL